jgi:ATP-dependent DNA ligase
LIAGDSSNRQPVVPHGPEFHRLACEHGVEGIVSKRINGRYEPDRRSWLKVKCLNREEFVVVGFSDPEGSRHRNQKASSSTQAGSAPVCPSPSWSAYGSAFSRW